jgi:hypothetical protein
MVVGTSGVVACVVFEAFTIKTEALFASEACEEPDGFLPTFLAFTQLGL